MSNVTDLTTEILVQIRDSVRETNARLDATNVRLDATNARLDDLRTEMRQGFADVRGAIADLDHVVLRHEESQRQLVERVERVEARLDVLEKRTG